MVCSRGFAYRDLEILLKLKSAMIGRNSSGLRDWVDDSSSFFPHCSFSGVSCDKDSGGVSQRLVCSSVRFNTAGDRDVGEIS